MTSTKMGNVTVDKTTGDAGPARTKRARESFWNLGNITALIALSSFFFGIGTVADLTHRLMPTRTASDARQEYLDKLRREYVKATDTVCQRTIGKVEPAPPGPVTYDWMMNVLSQRRQLAKDWGLIGGGVLSAADPTGTADVEKMLSEFRAADAFWAAIADDLKAGDVAAYNANLGLFITADGSFNDEARRFGFTTCSTPWPSVPPWQA
jgi:hypothetical protein